ncbi:aminotransferase class I/II-fold pyridoxal phosphate-dependent enzyme [Pseudoduganella sp. FT25W]|jgi:GntR family transcriptional regulator/MocR family aminotransferase|uniref:Aminotransferase class I/II-fold pyridoxal phosphate-dependent enzyme n=1 Tax=Duganella alba TaxID=2666081 RepID=A0A6L5QAP3_9BURK|nr:PLP-dependent aminotransferase family protein [Duganella alba]MRX06873.1 aminotransferase class I/II-fold pyridoxal phosphate-dependent enzyme [Duganella alba]MRX16230.1 aminotransferase class I/II-fold pyridoxal phosphate-dependent enzyme [Duganella alba]
MDFLQLDTSAAEPLYRQIYSRFRGAIADGLLQPGDRIPAARALALELGLARGTVESAYGLLTAEGYVEARGQAGTVVTTALARRAPAAPAPMLSSAPAHSNLGDAASSTRPFQMGIPALDVFPRKVWARLAARAVRATQPEDMIYPPWAGLPELRIAIATYLQLSRGIDCTPSQVFITNGYRNSMELVTRALLQPGDDVWVEDPGYPPTSELLRDAGLTPVPVQVDAEGLMVAHGVASAPRARAAIVTPAHQSPLCVSLSLPRRLALLDWAAQAGAWIVEDDYDGEYRYVSRPLPALKSLDRDGRVLYSGTFSKVLFPAIRLAYLVVPPAQVERFEHITRTFAAAGPTLMQHIVADFMNEGHFARHIQRMRRLYAERRQIAADGLAAALGRHVQVEPQPGGMHLVLRMKGRHSDRAVAARMREHGMSALALSERGVLPHGGPALLLAFTNIDTPARARELGKRILKIMA